jgi:hypothetical protein
MQVGEKIQVFESPHVFVYKYQRIAQALYTSKWNTHSILSFLSILFSSTLRQPIFTPFCHWIFDLH